MHYSVRYCAAACALSCGMLPDGRHPPTHTRTHGGSPALPLPYPCRPLPPAPPAPQIITGALLPDGGEVIKAKESMKIAYLTQEFDVEPGRTLREEFMSAFGDQMQVGDGVLFYHSNAKPTGVAGLARISKNGVIDETQFEPSSKYYDPKSKRDAPTWICVEVDYASTFAEVLTLDAMREVPGIEDMVLLRKGSRLSVQPVTAEEFKRVVAAAKKLGPVKR